MQELTLKSHMTMDAFLRLVDLPNLTHFTFWSIIPVNSASLRLPPTRARRQDGPHLQRLEIMGTSDEEVREGFNDWDARSCDVRVAARLPLANITQVCAGGAVRQSSMTLAQCGHGAGGFCMCHTAPSVPRMSPASHSGCHYIALSVPRPISDLPNSQQLISQFPATHAHHKIARHAQ